MRVSRIFLTVDIVLFRKLDLETQILLIKRKNEPFKEHWALPGGFVDEGEDIECAALRELKEETSIELFTLKQLGAFGKPNRDPRSHVVSIAYFAFVSSNTVAIANDDAKEAEWFYCNDLPKLAFDHIDIIKKAIDLYI